MLMNKQIVIGGMISVAVVAGIGVTILTNNAKQPTDSQTPKTSVTSSTSTTSDSTANTTSDDSQTQSQRINGTGNGVDGSSSASKEIAKYLDFTTADAFKKTTGTRVLFFYSDTSEAAKKLDIDIKKNILKFKDDTTIFKIDFDKNKDIANAYGVVRETTVLRFDDKGQVSNVFIAYDYPSASALKTNLNI